MGESSKVSSLMDLDQDSERGRRLASWGRMQELRTIDDNIYDVSRVGSSAPSQSGHVEDSQDYRSENHELNNLNHYNRQESDNAAVGAQETSDLVDRTHQTQQPNGQPLQGGEFDPHDQSNDTAEFNEHNQTSDEENVKVEKAICPKCRRQHGAIGSKGEDLHHKYFRFPRQKRSYGIFGGYLLLLVVIATLARFLWEAKTRNDVIAPAVELAVKTYRPGEAVPVVGSSLGVAEIILGSYFTRDSNTPPEIKAVYEASNGRICIRTRAGNIWLDKIRCVEEAKPKQLTPLTIIDSIQGFSIGNINSDGFLSSINHITDEKNETWIMSTLAQQKVKPHPNSKVTSTTWRRGLAGWFNYQDPDLQLREHGYDDFRYVRFRDSSGGPLGRAQEGSSFGISRYIIDGEEYEQIIFQSINGAFQGRKYVNGVWNKQEFSIEGTENGVELGASMTATTVSITNSTSIILLVYVTANGFVTIQTRGTDNSTDPGAFTAPQQLVQTDGRSDIGLAADGSFGIPRIYFFKNQKLLMLESDFKMKNWTTTEISFS